jgi:hypothetical protein
MKYIIYGVISMFMLSGIVTGTVDTIDNVGNEIAGNTTSAFDTAYDNSEDGSIDDSQIAPWWINESQAPRGWVNRIIHNVFLKPYLQDDVYFGYNSHTDEDV